MFVEVDVLVECWMRFIFVRHGEKEVRGPGNPWDCY